MKPDHCVRLFRLESVFEPRGFVPIPNTPICFEIGAGKGKHALAFAKHNPDQTLFALERTKNKAAAFGGYDCPQNLCFVHADALAWSVYALFPKQVSQCFILYPNPEPKNKNQRFVNMPYFEFLLSRMMDKGTIVIASNIACYIEECEEKLQRVWGLPYTKRTIAPDSGRSHFEIKYLSRGELCQELSIVKPLGYETRFDGILPKHLWD